MHIEILLRGMAAVAAAGGVGAAPLWAHGVSGDLPILLVRIDDIEHMALVRQLVHAHEYWHMKRLAVDLVIINERAVVVCAGFAGCARNARALRRRATAAAGRRRCARQHFRAARRPDVERRAGAVSALPRAWCWRRATAACWISCGASRALHLSSLPSSRAQAFAERAACPRP